MKINYAIIHTYDIDTDLILFSNKLLDTDDSKINNFITKHIEKSFMDTDFFTSTLEDQGVIETIDTIKSGWESFYQLSVAFSKEIFSAYSESVDDESFDILICSFSLDNQLYLGFLKLGHKNEFIRKVLTKDDSISISIDSHSSILPNFNNKLSEIVFININDRTIKIREKAKMINGSKHYILSDLVFKCQKKPTPNEAIKATTDIIKCVSEEFGIDPIRTVAKAKSIIETQIEEHAIIQPAEIGKQVFSDNYQCLERYNHSINEKSINCIIPQNSTINNKVRKHKIKTDTDIEIIFPSNYIEDGKYIDLKSNPDGTISIELKNIGKITNSI